MPTADKAAQPPLSEDALPETILSVLLAEEQELNAILERELQSATEALNSRGDSVEAPARTDRRLGGKADVIESLVEQVQASMRSGTGDRGSSLAFSFRDTPLTEEIGHLLYGVIAAHRYLYDFADQCFSACAPKTLVRYALEAALTAYTANKNHAAIPLLQQAATDLGPEFTALDDLTLLRLGQFAGAWGQAELVAEVVSCLRAREELDQVLRLRADILERDFASQAAMAARFGSAPDYFAVVQAARQQSAEADQGGPVRIGLFEYSNPTFPSNNIGDVFQTLGVVAELKQYGFSDLTAPASIRDLLEQPSPNDKRAIETPVEILPVSRDFSLAQADLGRIWLPVCGWFAHHVYHTHYGFPFAGNILPIFMSFHVARPEMITDEAVDYLKRFEPIGCRDLTTCRLLRDSGVRAFVNGCATLGLKKLNVGGAGGARSGKFVGDYRVQLRLAEDETVLEHLDTATWLRSFDENVEEALGFLGKYATAQAVRTPLLHCYLPCRSFGTPVKFIHSNMADPRFEGLVGLDDGPLNALHERFSQKFAIAMDAILAGKAPEEVYGIWEQACAEDMAATDRLIQEQDAAKRLSAGGISGEAFQDLPRTVYGPGERQGDDVNIIFCFDANFAEHFLPTFASLLANTERRICAWILGRDLPEAYFQTLTQLFPEVRFEHVDLSHVDYGEVRLLPHISVSTMDRLIAPALMPDVDRALYLDVDILVRGDIGALWDIDLGPAAIAARDSIHREWNTGTTLIYDVAKRFSADKASQFRSMIFSTGRVRFDAFNAGILVMDMAKLREDDFVRQATRVVEGFGVHDQFALNIYTRENRAKIPAAWNHFATQENIADPELVHFIGRVKPWTPQAYHAFKGEWEAHAEDIRRRRARLEQDGEAV